MKIKVIYTFFALILGATLFLSNAGGRASSAGKGNTGAPGDEKTGTSFRVCGTCHQGATTFQVSMAIEVKNAAGKVIVGYTPNETYDVKVTMTKSGNGNPKAYGFQMVSLFGANNQDVNGFSAPSANVQIEKASSTGRFYAEHKGPSASNIFSMKWKAPAVGSGKVSFYAAGNAIDGNGTSTGDSGSTTTLELSEGLKLEVESEALAKNIDLQIYPNPAIDNTSIFIKNGDNQQLTLEVIDLLGKQVAQRNFIASSDNHRESINLENCNKGIFFVKITNKENKTSVKKLIKE